MPDMHAIQMDNFGGPEVLHLRSLPIPQPRSGELLVKIKAASVNPVDYKIREGKFPPVTQEMLPYMPGRDLAGEVVAQGPGPRLFETGAPVYAFLSPDRGTYAEYQVIKDTEAARAPHNIELTIAAAVPLAGITAWQALFRYGHLQRGQRVLIHAGAGGVGHLAVQFAKAKGAWVAATVATEHVPFVRELGVDEVIDYKTERFEDRLHDLDLVIDLVAGETQDRSWMVLKRGGTMVSTLAQPDQTKAAQFGVHATRFMAEPSGAELKEIAALIEQEKVRPIVTKLFPLDQAAAAQEYVKKGHTAGKVVLTLGTNVTMYE